MTHIFFDVSSEGGDLQERLTFTLYNNVNAQVKEFLLKMLRETDSQTFSYRGSLIYTFTSSFFIFGNLIRRGITSKVPISDPQYPFKVPKLGAGRPITRAGHLCLIPADATSSSQELMVTLKDCTHYHKDIVCVGELDGDPAVLDKISRYTDTEMLRAKRIVYIENCGVEGEALGPKSSLVDINIQEERTRRANEKKKEMQWNAIFEAKLKEPTIDMANVYV